MTLKSFLTPGLLVLFVSLVQAQPILQNNVLPQIGDSYWIASADTNLITHGNPGANQTWDFTDLHPLGDTFRVQYKTVAPDSTPYAIHYPTATVANEVQKDTFFYAYFYSNPNQLSFLGDGSLYHKQVYSNPDTRLTFPTAFNETKLDTFAYTSDFGQGFIFITNGYRSTTYDGYGTLITPLGSFPNAMRIKSVATYTDSVNLGGVQLLNHHELTTYAWLLTDQPDYLTGVYYLKTTNETRIPGFDTTFMEAPVVKSVSYISETSVGTKGLAPGVDGISILVLAPVPARDHLTLRFHASKAVQNLQLRLTDAFGRILQTRLFACSSGENEVLFSVDQLPSGSYFLMLTDGRGVLAVRWQKH